jgi:hypothetical protein
MLERSTADNGFLQREQHQGKVNLMLRTVHVAPGAVCGNNNSLREQVVCLSWAF